MKKMMEILVATSNGHKISEIRSMLDRDKFRVLSLMDIGYNKEIQETGMTMEENALIKARALQSEYSKSIIGEDSGLEIYALDMVPGVQTARFAGPDKDPVKNMEKVLKLMKGVKDRSARFRTVIAFIHKGKEYILEGVVNGTISAGMMGEKGFGYDPIFIPEGYHRTFAELGKTIKNKMSHRARAIDKLVKLLATLDGQ